MPYKDTKKKAYYWDRDTINDGFSHGWRILTEKIIRQHIVPVKIQFT